MRAIDRAMLEEVMRRLVAAPDLEVLGLARESGRVLVTQDRDFGMLPAEEDPCRECE